MSVLVARVKFKIERLKSHQIFRRTFLRRSTWLAIACAYILITLFTYMFRAAPVQAAISPRASSPNSGRAASLQLTKPTGTIAGDLMIATVVIETAPAVTAPTGGTWTLIRRTPNATNMVTETYYRLAVASDTNWTWSWTGTLNNAGAIISYKGVDITNPIDGPATGSTNTGNSTTPTAATLTTTAANAMLVASFGVAANTSFTAGSSGMAEEFDRQSNCGFACGTNVTASGYDVIQGTAGASGTKAVSSGTGQWAANMVALKPAPAPTVSMGAYRFLSNLDNANPEWFTAANSPSNTADNIRGLAVDSANGYFYIGGYTSTEWRVQKRRIDDGSLDGTFSYPTGITGNVGGISLDPTGNYVYIAGNSGGTWRIEKRRTTDAALCTAANCGTAFDTDGIINSGTGFPTAGSLNSIDIDGTNGFIYAGGYDSNTNDKWIIGKFATSNGAPAAGFQQSAGANCTSNPGYVCNNPGTGSDRIRTVSVDPQNGYIYAGGWYAATDTDWRMEKRRVSDGALCTAANCGTQFATGGVYTEDPGVTDQILTFQVDTPGNAIYVGGLDSAPGNNEWRLEKLNATTGALCTAGTCGTNAFGTGGILTINPGTGDDQLLDLDLDDAGGFIYITGQEDVAGSNMRWRIEKRFRDTGNLCSLANGCATSFGSGGVVTVDPSGADDAPAWISVDLPRNLLYTSGGDSTSGNQDWRIQKFDLDYGGIWLNTPQDTAALASTNVTFRLRLLLRVTSQQAIVADQQYKLQFATKVGTCDTSYTDESYADVTTTTAIKFHNNPSVADSTALFTPVPTGDPTDGANPIVTQTIKESNNFSPATDTPAGSDMEFDYSLQDNNSFGVYCFRVVYSDGSAVAAPNVVPEISFCRNTPNTDALLRNGTYFCGGVKKPFFWAQ